MNINISRGAYEAPRTEVILLNTECAVLTGSPVTPDAGIMGTGLTFGTQDGAW